MVAFSKGKAQPGEAFGVQAGKREKGVHLQHNRWFGNCEEQAAEISQQAPEMMEKSPLCCAQQAYMSFLLNTSGCIVGFCKINLLLAATEGVQSQGMV